MNANRIFTAKGITGYVVQCEDGTYHATSKTLRILAAKIAQTYVSSHIGRGMTDITETPEGRVLLRTVNQNAVRMETDRAQTAASARWGNRGESASIRVDRDVAADLATVPEQSRRQLASTAIRRALGSDGEACTAFGFAWGMMGKDVTDALRSRKVLFVPPKKGISAKDYTPAEAAKILVQNEIDSLAHKLKVAVDFDPRLNAMEHVPRNWLDDLNTSRMLLGVGDDCMPILAVAAYIDFIAWARK